MPDKKIDSKDPLHLTLSPAAISAKRTILCQNSGVPLAILEVLIFEGHLPVLEAHDSAPYFHPFYRISPAVLIKKLEESLRLAQDSGWINTPSEQKRLQLLTSSLLFSLDAVKQECATLPSYTVASASASRLLALAKWFFFVSAGRLQFPVYHVTKKNDNLQWDNFKHWLDSAFEIRAEWSKNVKSLEIAEKQRLFSLSLKEINSESYRRIDTRKVWKWMEMQLLLKYAAGRVETFKSLFLNGDVEPHEWTIDDVEDLKYAITESCDIGNEITFFINKRLNGILALIRDFYSSFTLLGKKPDVGNLQEDKQTPQELAMIEELDRRLDSIDVLPPAPVRASFTSNALFWKAQAQWNILARRFKSREAQTESVTPTNPKDNPT